MATESSSSSYSGSSAPVKTSSTSSYTATSSPVRTSSGGGGGSIRKETTVTSVSGATTMPGQEPQKTKIISQTTERRISGAGMDIRVIERSQPVQQEIKLTSRPYAGPSSDIAAYNAAYAAAGEINKQLGGQEYVIVKEGAGGYYLQQNPAISPQPGIDAEIRRRLSRSGVTVEERDGVFFVRSAAAGGTADGGMVQEGAAPSGGGGGVFDFTTEPAPVRSQAEVAQLTAGVMAKQGYIPISQEATGEQVYIRPASRGPSIPFGVGPTTGAGGTAELAPVYPAAGAAADSPFVQTPLQYIYKFKLGESLRQSAKAGVTAIAGEGVAGIIDIPFGVAGYAADIAFETVKVGSTPFVYGVSAARGASFAIREEGVKAGIPFITSPTEGERAEAISDFAAVLPYAPSVPLFVTFTAQAAAKPTGVVQVGQQKTIGGIKVQAGGAEFKTVLGAPTKYDAAQFQAGAAENVFGGRFAVGESPGIVPAGTAAKPVPFSVEMVVGTVKGTYDPFRLSIRDAAISGAILGGYEAGVQIVSGKPIDVGRIAQATAAGGFIIYSASKYVPLAESQQALIAAKPPPDTIEGTYEYAKQPALGGGKGGQPKLPDQFSNAIIETSPYAQPPATRPAGKPPSQVTVAPGDFIIVGSQTTRPGPVGTQRQMLKYRQRTELIEQTREVQLDIYGGTKTVVVEMETPFITKPGQRGGLAEPGQKGTEGQQIYRPTGITDIFKPPVTGEVFKPVTVQPVTVQPGPEEKIVPFQPPYQPPYVDQPVVTTEQTMFQGTSAPVTTLAPPPTEQPPVTNEFTFKGPSAIIGGLALPFLFPSGRAEGGSATGRAARPQGEARSLLEAAIPEIASGKPISRPARKGKSIFDYLPKR
jgi:hypothetical protein